MKSPFLFRFIKLIHRSIFLTFEFSRYLKYGSYPVINPDGAEFPSHFRIHQSPIYESHFVSDGSHHVVNVTSPTPGDWYAVAFLPIGRGRITQKVGLTAILLPIYISPQQSNQSSEIVSFLQGLFPNCTIWLESSVAATVISDVIVVFPEVQAHQEIQLYQEIENASQTYK